MKRLLLMCLICTTQFLFLTKVSIGNELIGSSKKVFAHYLPSFPQKINNKLPGEDYYTTSYLNPYGESGKYFKVGGLLRERPIARTTLDVDNSSDWLMADAKFQVRQAAAIGLDGFAINLFGNTGDTWIRALNIFEAAKTVRDFNILIVTDMSSSFRSDDPYDTFVPTILALSKQSASLRLDDGRLVISPYLFDRQSPSWWKKALDALKKEGVTVAVIPLYQGWYSNLTEFREQEPETYSEYIVGVSEWGPRSPSGGYNMLSVAESVHKEGLLWMAPVAPQDSRPRSYIYTESGNSEAYRALWESAINGNADWVKIITWNDYSESSQIAPSTQVGYSFYDLTAYYVDWFKSGKQPVIDDDVMYAFYREQNTEVSISGDVQSKGMSSVNGEVPRNEIELLAFLKESANLEIEINNSIHRLSAEQGVVSFKVPLENGTPVFRIIRDDQILQEMTGPTSIQNDGIVDVQDMTYWGKSSARSSLFQNKQYLSWPRKTNSQSGSYAVNADIKSPFSRNSDMFAEQLNFVNGYAHNGFTYEFLPVSSDSPTIISFDVNLKSYCVGQSTLVLKLGDGDVSGVEIELCNHDKNSTELQNREINKDFQIPNTSMSSNAWRQIRIILSPMGQYKNEYEVLVLNEEGTSVGYKGLITKAKIEEFNTIKFDLAYAQRASVSIVIDNITVSASSHTF
ncbi:glycoside hydrolase family 71 protein [Paraglaciecola sp. 2405UD69-4]|uniref:glycoside hydrolase family 71 protein n=1 Tax=Paraglaciecola sp. 2405UD69-4 TaxID=3391836 RepID=UPI0039C92D6C